MRNPINPATVQPLPRTLNSEPVERKVDTGERQVSEESEVILPQEGGMKREFQTKNAHYWKDLLETAQRVSASFTDKNLHRGFEDTVLSRQLSLNVLENTLEGMETLSLSSSERNTLSQLYTDMADVVSRSGADKLSTGLPSAVETAGADPNKIYSDKELCEIIARLMGGINTNYLKVYEYAVKQQSELWKDISTMQTNLNSYFKATGDKIVFDFNTFRNVYITPLLLKYQGAMFRIYPRQAYTYVSEAEAQKWANELGAAKAVKMAGVPDPNNWYVSADESPVMKILESTYEFARRVGTDKTVELTPTEFQSWLTGFNVQIENAKTNTQTITTKYSSANSLYDSIIKLLTNSVSALFDSAKEYMRW